MRWTKLDTKKLPTKPNGEIAYDNSGTTHWRRAWYGSKVGLGEDTTEIDSSRELRACMFSATTWGTRVLSQDPVLLDERLVVPGREFWSVLWEVMADKSARVVKRGMGQWIQPEHSVHLVALWVRGFEETITTRWIQAWRRRGSGSQFSKHTRGASSSSRMRRAGSEVHQAQISAELAPLHLRAPALLRRCASLPLLLFALMPLRLCAFVPLRLCSSASCASAPVRL